jgi:hypothetical protein
MTPDWFNNHENLAVLVRWAARVGYSVDDVADMVAEPWKWRAEFVAETARLLNEKLEARA